MSDQEPRPIYENPYAATDLVMLDPPVVESTARPVFIAILAVLQIVGGLLVLVSAITLLRTSAAVGSVTSLRLLRILLPLAVLRIVTGVGMWAGTRWGWWLASTYYMMQLFSSIATIVFVVYSFDLNTDMLGRPPTYLIGRGIGGSLFASLVLAVLYRDRVLAFFHMVGQPKRMAVLVTVFTGFILYLTHQLAMMY